MKIQIPEGDFGGYIFDLDGTLVDTMPLHYTAWEAALRKAGLKGSLDENLFYELGGVPSRKVAALLGKRHGLTLDPVAVYKDKEEVFKASLQKLSVIAPVVDFARRVSKSRPVAIASGGTRDVVESTLRKTGLAELFPVVVTADDVEHGKPAPDMFLLAAKRMGVPPGTCLVFEDGKPGIKAAEAAGMKWVFVQSRLLV
ncbi:MAG: HAD family phosphatase [Opitutaceae bacterium]|jgi:beta-phosphoglucomutase family hydrolase